MVVRRVGWAGLAKACLSFCGIEFAVITFGFLLRAWLKTNH